MHPVMGWLSKIFKGGSNHKISEGHCPVTDDDVVCDARSSTVNDV